MWREGEGAALAEELEDDAVAEEGVPEQEEGGDGGVGGPEHGDEQRRYDVGPRNQLPDAHLCDRQNFD